MDSKKPGILDNLPKLVQGMAGLTHMAIYPLLIFKLLFKYITSKHIFMFNDDLRLLSNFPKFVFFPHKTPVVPMFFKILYL